MNERDIFAEAAALAGEARAAFLNEACGMDAALRARVEALLAAHDEAPDFLETPLTAPPVAAHELVAGDRIGHYLLRQKLGEGGCGVVWMAEQVQPLRRRVALKVIKLGMDTREVIARFEAERQALALMDHPNIAKVIDAGATDAGRPYFVMELVRGVPITKYCDELALPMPARLDLFLQVCHAVQHAHQKGVIHRDLKPSNILVMLTDGGAVPKVIDFGIAKATRGRLADQTIFTSFEQFIGTPAYISPEQAELSGLDVDTRSDIYSLGVLLYELLTGRPPFDPKELAAAGLDEMRRRIRETEPPRPSTRLGTLQREMLATIARQRQTAAPELIAQVRGDLDWIVMRCLEKDRTRRYPTAVALADDVLRHLHDEPVAARPPSRIYRLNKLIRRNRLTFAALGAIVAVLVVAVLLASSQAVRARRAELAAIRAGQEESRLREVAERAQRNEADARRRAEAESHRAARGELAARRQAYAADMQSIQQALGVSNFSHARALLERHRPAGTAQPDFRGWEWRYLWQQLCSDATGTLAEGMRIAQFEVSADGNWLAGVRQELRGIGDIVLWDLRTRQPVPLRSTPASYRIRIAFAPHAPLLAVAWTHSAAGRGEHWLGLWDVSTTRLLRQWRVPGAGYDLRFTPDGKSVVAILQGGQAELGVWRASDGAPVRRVTLPGPGPAAGESAVLAPTARFAAIDRTSQISVIDTLTGEERWKVPGTGSTAMAFSPDGNVLASAAVAERGVIRLWEAASGRPLGTLEGHHYEVRGFAFWPDGRKLATGSQDQTIRLWDLESRTLERAFIGTNNTVISLAWLPDRRTLVSSGGSGDPTVFLWDTAAHPFSRDVVRLGPGVATWCFGPDAGSVITLNRSGDVIRWHGRNWSLRDFRISVPDVSQFAQAYGRIHVSAEPPIVALSDQNGVTVWDWERRSQIRQINPPALSPPLIVGLVEDGRRLLLIIRTAAKPQPHLTEWELATGRLRRTWPPYGGGFAATLSPDRRQCLITKPDSWTVLDLAAPPDQRPAPNTSVRGATVVSSLSPDGRFVARAASLHAKILDLKTLAPITELRGYMHGVGSTAFSPDGERLALTAATSEAVVLYDVVNWERVLTLTTPDVAIARVGFSPDRNAVGAMSVPAGNLFLWRAPTWAEIESAEAAQKARRPSS